MHYPHIQAATLLLSFEIATVMKLFLPISICKSNFHSYQSLWRLMLTDAQIFVPTLLATAGFDTYLYLGQYNNDIN